MPDEPLKNEKQPKKRLITDEILRAAIDKANSLDVDEPLIKWPVLPASRAESKK